ncbi:GPW/gp25 family protein [Flindersiella endophytica]
MTTLRGMSMPFRIENGHVRQSTGAAKVSDDVRQLLSTRLGERVLRRSYGGGVHQRLQQPNDHTLRTLIRHEIEQALRNHLPLARLTSPIRLTHNESELTVTFDYAIDSNELAQHVALTLPRSS